MISPAKDARAERLVRKAIDRALAEMRRYVTKALLEGREPDKRMMVQIANGLNRLAEEYAIDLTAGPWGDMIEEAMKLGAKDAAKMTGGQMLRVSKREVEAALYKGYGLIKGIMSEGEKVVAEEMLRSIVGGASKKQIVEALKRRLTVIDKSGEEGAIPAWRAELIARNELSENYRTVAEKGYEEAGFKYRKMVGPDDDRTARDICSRYLGQVHSVEEWEKIGRRNGRSNLLIRLWHVNCRHNFIPVAEEDVEEAASISPRKVLRKVARART